jgi:hypothetical protein
MELYSHAEFSEIAKAPGIGSSYMRTATESAWHHGGAQIARPGRQRNFDQ